MKAYLSRRYHFVASHRLHTAQLNAEQNTATYGKCNNPFGHGHNYTVQVTYSGSVDAVTGMVFDLGRLDSFAQERVLHLLDHQNLNTLNVFTDLVPTSENLAVVLHGMFSDFTEATLERVHVEETPNNSFDYGQGAGLPKSVEGKYE